MFSASGIVITLSRDSGLADEVIRDLGKHAQIEMGDLKGKYLPAVISARNDRDLRLVHRHIESLSGVDYVDVVFVSYDQYSNESSEDNTTFSCHET